MLVIPDWPMALYSATQHQLHHLRFQPPFDGEGIVLGALVDIINATVALNVQTPFAHYDVFLRACSIPLTSEAVWPSLQATLAKWYHVEPMAPVSITTESLTLSELVDV